MKRTQYEQPPRPQCMWRGCPRLNLLSKDVPFLPESPGTIGTLPPERVYYVRVGEHIKIGYTRNVSNRLSGYPPNSELLAVELGNKTLEKERHHQFHAYLAWGREWFADCQEIRKDQRIRYPPSSRGIGGR